MEIGSYLGLKLETVFARLLPFPGRGLHRGPAEAHPDTRREWLKALMNHRV
jgi:hypothetical protein